MEFKEFELRFKSAKTRFKFSAGLNLETFDTGHINFTRGGLLIWFTVPFCLILAECVPYSLLKQVQSRPEAEFKEFEPRLKFGWFHLKLYSIFQD